MEEIWNDVSGYIGIYQVSNLGRVRNALKNIVLKQYLRGARKDNLYYSVYLYKRGEKRKIVKTHRLVALAFIPNPLNKPQVNHKDLNKLNNLVSNLEWATRFENCQHSWDSGMRFPTEKMREAGRKYSRINFKSSWVKSKSLT